VDTIGDFLDGEVAAILAAVDTEVAAVKAKTDSLTFTVANVIDANVKRINGTVVNGDGGGTPWGP
jgi:secreted PhoX family phosphatase